MKKEKIYGWTVLLTMLSFLTMLSLIVVCICVKNHEFITKLLLINGGVTGLLIIIIYCIEYD